jgi:alkyldihydroxyacetonephosphate synthase
MRPDGQEAALTGREMRWYGWGYADVTFSLENRPAAWPYLQASLELRGDESFRPVRLGAIKLRPSRLAPEAVGQLQDMLGGEAVIVADPVRLVHSVGQSYRDLVCLRQGTVVNATDAVLFPHSDEDIQKVLAFAASNGLAVVPFGGGTSVVGGVEPRGDRPALTLSLARMNRVLALDAVSQNVTVEAGVLGPDLERAVNERGFTVGHFPQSFEFSTVGGWIATRGAGQASTKYGAIAERVISLRVLTPAGVIDTRLTPASASGPSLLQLLVGSEGVFGVITRATLRLAALPTVVAQRAMLFGDFERGLAAVRAILQAGLTPAVVRLSDEQETRTQFALREARTGWSGVKERLGLAAIARAGLSLENGALLILRFEGNHDRARVECEHALELCRRQQAFDLGAGPARGWQRDRFHTPYLRDTLMDRGLLVDVVETSTEWDQVAALHTDLAGAINGAIEASGSKAIVMTHLSHAYPDGASLYVTFLARRMPEREMEQWQAIKNAAMEVIMRRGGAISHHHGVGYEHAAWMEVEDGSTGVKALRGVKQALDPQSIMNPHKMFPP